MIFQTTKLFRYEMVQGVSLLSVSDFPPSNTYMHKL